MQAIIDKLMKEFAAIRTGRANASMLDGVRVEAYGNMIPLNQLALVTVIDWRTLMIQPWDAAQLKEIEKAITKSPGLFSGAITDGKVIRLMVPLLTEERRGVLTKAVGKLAEDARVAIRSARREAIDTLKAQKVSKDEERRAHDQIQKTTDRFIAKINELAAKKAQEVMTV